MFAIFGSGFGLYGYLPALVEGCSERVILPERYRARFALRAELQHLEDRILWVTDERAQQSRARGAVLALRPAEQQERANSCLAASNIGLLILEKPIAQTPAKANQLLDRLLHSKKTFRIGYTFRFTPWGRKWLEQKPNGHSSPFSQLQITWTFKAHHFAHNLANWKRDAHEGGGAVRFYGIHLIALLAELGYTGVELPNESKINIDSAERWEAIFTGPNLPNVAVNVDSNCNRQVFVFQGITAAGQTQDLYQSSGPFGEPVGAPGQADARIAVLVELCKSLLNDLDPPYAWYAATHDLWQRLEQMVGTTLPNSVDFT